jgi:hypothetical protein
LRLSACLRKDQAMMVKHFGVAAFILVVMSGCNSPTDPSKNTTDTLTNTVAPQMVDIKIVSVPNTGEYSVKLTQLTPGNVFVGIAWGQSSGGSCAPIQSQPALSSSNVGHTVLSGSVLIKGDYCVIVFDPYATLNIASWPVQQTYTIEVSHP